MHNYRVMVPFKQLGGTSNKFDGEMLSSWLAKIRKLDALFVVMMRSMNIRFNVTHTVIIPFHNNCRAINPHITCFYPPFDYSNRPLDRLSLCRCRQILFWLERHRLQKGKMSILRIFCVLRKLSM
jgi:hypothetical protein